MNGSPLPPVVRPIEASGLILPGFPDASPFNLQLTASQHCLITGPAGSGKTTLARTLLGLISPLQGSLSLFGQDLDRISGRELLALRRRAAFLQGGDGDGLFPAWSAFDNLALAIGQHNPELASRPEALAETLHHEAERYGIPTRWLEEPIAQRRRQQRTAIALWRALRPGPSLVIIDGLLLDQNLVGNAIDVDSLLTDALAGKPAIIILAAESPNTLPARLQPESFRRGRMQAGRLEWLSMEAAANPAHA